MDDLTNYEEMAQEKRALANLLMKFLDLLDYTAGNCREDDPVGLALPQGVIREAKSLLYRVDVRVKR